MALTLQPVPCTESTSASATSSIIAIVATDLLGDVKGEWWSDSSTEAMHEVHRLIAWPDTKVYLYDTDNAGERAFEPFAMITAGGYYAYPAADAHARNYKLSLSSKGVAT